MNRVDFKAEGKISTSKQEDGQKVLELSESTGIADLHQGPQALQNRQERLSTYVSTALSLCSSEDGRIDGGEDVVIAGGKSAAQTELLQSKKLSDCLSVCQFLTDQRG